MKLAALLRRSGTAEEFTDHDLDTSAPSAKGDDAALRRDWDHLRRSAESGAERTEIDAFFSRVMP